MSGELDLRKNSHQTKFWFIAISLNQKRDKNEKGRLWEHETMILGITFVTLTENSFVVINDNQEPPGISTLPEISAGPHFRAWHGTKTTPVFLFTVGKAFLSRLFVATFKFGLFTVIRRHSPTRKHLFLYHQEDRSGLNKPKKGKH